MSSREEIIDIFSHQSEAKIKQAKGFLKDQIPGGRVESVKDEVDLAELLMGHFPSGERKKHILDILKKTKSEDVIEKFRNILSAPSKRTTNGGSLWHSMPETASAQQADQLYTSACLPETPVQQHQEPAAEPFTEWATRSGLSSKTIDILINHECDNYRALIYLEEESIPHLKLSMGQLGIFKSAVNSLRKSYQSQQYAQTSSRPTPPQEQVPELSRPSENPDQLTAAVQMIPENYSPASTVSNQPAQPCQVNTATATAMLQQQPPMANTRADIDPTTICVTSLQANGGATSPTTEISATSSNTLETVLPDDTHLYPKLMRTQQQAQVNGGTTSSTTGSSATSSNTGVPVSAADKHPVRVVRVPVCVRCGNKEAKKPSWFCAECETKAVDRFNLLLAKTAEEITGREVKQMKTMLIGRDIYEPEPNDTAIGIFRDLAKKEYISPTDQTLLIALLEGIERPDLVLLVKKYQDKYCIPQSQRLLEKTQSKQNLHPISNVQAAFTSAGRGRLGGIMMLLIPPVKYPQKQFK